MNFGLVSPCVLVFSQAFNVPFHTIYVGLVFVFSVFKYSLSHVVDNQRCRDISRGKKRHHQLSLVDNKGVYHRAITASDLFPKNSMDPYPTG